MAKALAGLQRYQNAASNIRYVGFPVEQTTAEIFRQVFLFYIPLIQALYQFRKVPAVESEPKPPQNPPVSGKVPDFCFLLKSAQFPQWTSQPFSAPNALEGFRLLFSPSLFPVQIV